MFLFEVTKCFIIVIYMQSTRKKYYILFLISFVSGLIVIPFDIQAQQAPTDATPWCLTCWSAPAQLEEFVAMTEAILSSMDNKYITGSIAGHYKTFWPWQAWLYWQALNNDWIGIWQAIVISTLKSLERKRSYLQSTSTLLTVYSTDIITDGVLSFVTIFQQQPIIRDYQRLLDLDITIGHKLDEIGIAWGIGKAMDKSTISSIKEILQRYTWEGKILNSFEIEDNIHSEAILLSLLRLNKKHKNIVVTGTSITNHETSKNTITKWWFLGIFGENITLQTNQDYRSAFTASYLCVQARACNTNRSWFTQNISNITKSFVKSGPKNSREIIKKASRRLQTRSQQLTNNTDSDSYKKNLADYEAREAELLSILGTKKREKWQSIISIRKTLQDISKKDINKKSFKDRLTTTTNTIWTVAKDTRNSLFGKKLDEEENIDNDSATIILSPDGTRIQYNISTQLDRIEKEHDNWIKNQSIASTDDSIKQLTELLKKIRLISNSVYNPNSKNTIYETIARTCELQCSNLWGKCRL